MKQRHFIQGPYGVAKMYGHWITKNYREAYNIFASNGILFNHRSPRRVKLCYKKNYSCFANILGSKIPLYLGNLSAKRDWGHARDYVEAQWLILQHTEPEDFIVLSVQYSVRDFIVQ